ncbi:MAG: hypothetical protein QM741_01150 [Rudaea sp.]|uniref:hypothetical protein n=1 Tax=Rudaea sp. TaxID=2136325 RepID=UPI0039E4688C
MSAAFARLKSMLPTRTDAGDAAFVSEPKALRGWLDNLPLVNRGFALLRLHDMLREFNVTPIAARQRLSMLAMFEGVAAGLVDDARNEAREFFPMSAERLEDARLASEIERDLALGYIAVVCELCAPSGEVSFLRRSVVAKALTYACWHQGMRLWLASRTHRKPAEGVWRGLHDLFHFAIECGCADQAKLAMADGMRASVRSVYAQALLHAFARPNQFTQQQNRQLHASLPVLASWCDIRPGYAPPGAIAVYAAGDSSPPTLPRSGPVDAGDRWLLDIGPLLVQFEILLAARGEASEVNVRARRDNVRATLSVDTIEVLKRVWSERIEREFLRNPGVGMFETEVGLPGLHTLLTGERDLDFVLPPIGEASGSVAGGAMRGPGSAAKYALAKVVDRSRRGYRLLWEVGEDARARVGELIALTALGPKRPRQWSYGILRWLRADPKLGIEAGVELLPCVPVAVAVYAFDANGIARAPVRGILVDSQDAGPKRSRDAGIWVSRPFTPDAVVIEVLRFDAGAREDASRPVRIATFSVRDAGLYQKIVLPDEALDRIVQPAMAATNPA